MQMDCTPARRETTVHLTLGNSLAFDRTMFTLTGPPLTDACRRLYLVGATVVRNPAFAAASSLDFESLWFHLDEPDVSRGTVYQNLQATVTDEFKQLRTVTCLLRRTGNDTLTNHYSSTYLPVGGDERGRFLLGESDRAFLVGRMRASWGSATNHLMTDDRVQMVVFSFVCEH